MQYSGWCLTSPSLECLFMRSSVSNFSFWFGTTLGILNIKRGFGGSAWWFGCIWGWNWWGWGGAPAPCGWNPSWGWSPWCCCCAAARAAAAAAAWWAWAAVIDAAENPGSNPGGEDPGGGGGGPQAPDIMGLDCWGLCSIFESGVFDTFSCPCTNTPSDWLAVLYVHFTHLEQIRVVYWGTSCIYVHM